ncbi:KH domain-containing, RNA-binding, signal transduction-associated protein 2 [Elysia marginata]|uniref:KH domain-containing, RNA-binding, signal transduction-associated protein 2 n=1 Tax=Elysia marginata TaxID=1093978 RepID=A0AAV4EB31_9GAST|nr:KH domain-containing, RNA-binding, signal transduction-associated protein 2 [Elysia marginata]
MASSGSYIEQLENELKQTDPNSHANRLVTQELDRLNKGEDRQPQEEKKDRSSSQLLELHHDKPVRASVKVRIPVKEYPKYNFVGKLLGPKGQTLKGLQDQTGCKMAIMGKGSMRDKEKEEELRKEGGKYAHLNDELHVSVECFTESIDGQHRIAAALLELKKFLIPEMNDEMYGGGDMGGEMGVNGGAPRGRGGFRGAPPERGRGSFRGRGNGPAPPPGGRGGPAGRGGPPPRGAPRGGPAGARGGPAPRGGPGPAARGAPAARGGGVGAGRAPPPAAPTSYDAYGTQQSYSVGAYSTGYDNSYDESYGQDGSYYDYGQTATANTGYDSYSSGGYGEYSDYSDGGWGATASGGAGAGKAPAAPTRGAARGGVSRPHPYSRPGPAQGGY